MAGAIDDSTINIVVVIIIIILYYYISTIRWCLWHIFDVLGTIFIWPCDLLDLWPFDLCGVSSIKLHTSNAHTNFELPTIYPFLSYVWLNLITVPSHGTVTAHAPCHMPYHRRQNWSTF